MKQTKNVEEKLTINILTLIMLIGILIAVIGKCTSKQNERTNNIYFDRKSIQK